MAVQAMPSRFHARYDIKSGILTLGSADVSFCKLPDAAYLMAVRVHASGIFALFYPGVIHEVSRGRLSTQGFEPTYHRYLREGGRKHEDKQMRFERAGAGALVTAGKSTRPVPGDSLDRAITPMQLIYELDNGRTRFQMHIVEGGKTKNFRARVIGRESVKTSIGTFQALKVEVKSTDGGSRRLILWCAPRLGNMIVKAVQEKSGDDLVEIVLANLSEAGWHRGTPAASDQRNRVSSELGILH